MEARFAAIVADAAKKYSEASSRPLDDYMSPPMRSVEDLKKQLDLQNDQFKQFRAKRHHIFAALSTAFLPVEIIGEMAAGAAGAAFAPSQNIFAAVMYLINAAHNVSSMYDNIIELFDQLKVRPQRRLPCDVAYMNSWLILLQTGLYCKTGCVYTAQDITVSARKARRHLCKPL